MKEAWYETWFDSSYYHILYHNRDEVEAQSFIQRLASALSLRKGGKIIDIGCGKGRHSIFLNNMGFEVQGIDLSLQNIRKSKAFESTTLSFDVHDMRNVFRSNYYDYAFNLFTSFGYFEDEADDLRSLSAMAHNLKPNGLLVLDYLNTVKVEKEVKSCTDHEIVLQGIRFRISKKIQDEFIIKQIDIEDHGQHFEFSERVKMLHLNHFQQYMDQVGLEIQSLFGSYELSPFDPDTADRLIIIACKK